MARVDPSVPPEAAGLMVTGLMLPVSRGCSVRPMTPSSEFSSELAAAKNRATWGLGSLYREMHPALLRYLQAKEPGDADDLASDVWLAVARHLDRFDGDEAAFRGWVFTMASRCVADHRRTRRRRRTVCVPTELLPQRAAPDDPEALVVGAIEAQAAVNRLTRRLPPAQAEVVLLRVVGGLDVVQVARLMGRSTASIRMLQHRALRRLARTY